MSSSLPSLYLVFFKHVWGLFDPASHCTDNVSSLSTHRLQLTSFLIIISLSVLMFACLLACSRKKRILFELEIYCKNLCPKRVSSALFDQTSFRAQPSDSNNIMSEFDISYSSHTFERPVTSTIVTSLPIPANTGLPEYNEIAKTRPQDETHRNTHSRTESLPVYDENLGRRDSLGF